MPTSYSGTPVLNTSITIPVDTDNANANSVNVSSKALMDSQVLLYQVYGQLMQSTSAIRIYDNGDDKNITVQPVPNVLVTEAGAWKIVFTTLATTIGVANIEGAPADYSANTWYYIYAYSDMGTCKFQISPTGPDEFNLYKNGSFAYKFLASFRTNGANNIVRFHKYGNFVNYLIAQAIGSGASTTPVQLNSDQYVPPNPAAGTVVRMVRLQINIDASLGQGAVIQMSPDSSSVGQSIAYSTGQVNTIFTDNIVDSNRRIYYSVPSAVGVTVINYFLTGYYE